MRAVALVSLAVLLELDAHAWKDDGLQHIQHHEDAEGVPQTDLLVPERKEGEELHADTLIDPEEPEQQGESRRDDEADDDPYDESHDILQNCADHGDLPFRTKSFAYIKTHFILKVNILLGYRDSVTSH